MGFDIAGEDHSADDTGTWKSTAAAVSVGDVANKVTRQITGVAAGTQDTDAVNVAQLKGVQAGITNMNNTVNNMNRTVNDLSTKVNDNSQKIQNVQNTVNQHTDQINQNKTEIQNNKTEIGNINKKVENNDNRITTLETNAGGSITNLENRIDNLEDDSNRGDAMNAALAALHPLQFDLKNPTQIMAGVGYYRNAKALALGLAHYENEDTMMHAGMAYSGNSHFALNAGLTWKFGMSKKHRERMPERYQPGPISSVYVLEGEMALVMQENERQKEKLAFQEAKIASQDMRLAELEAKLAKLLAEK